MSCVRFSPDKKGNMQPDDYGNWVKAEVYDDLADEHKKLKKQNDTMKFMLGELFGMDLSSIGIVRNNETTNIDLGEKP
jgi:hypothetical protein